MLRDYKVVAVTHRRTTLDTIGRFHVEEDSWKKVLSELKEFMGWKELMYLTTCNRVEFFIYSKEKLNLNKLAEFFTYSQEHFKDIVEVYEGSYAVEHIFRVASSLDSMVIGEREIITQVRRAFELSRKYGMAGDNIRVALRKTIEHAKRVYTETGIASKPVSVVSLAFREFKALDIKKDARIIIIGAGQTNRALSRFVAKAGYKELTFYNRTKSKAEELAKECGGEARDLPELINHEGGVDVIMTCTGAEDSVLTKEIFDSITSDNSKVLVIDLAIPSDTDRAVRLSPKVDYLSIQELQPIAEKNLKERASEVKCCEEILSESLTEFEMMYEERRVERAMKDVPVQIKELRTAAVEKIFAQEIASMNKESREVMDKVIDYLEKKYISGPIKIAKEIILEKRHGQ